MPRVRDFRFALDGVDVPAFAAAFSQVRGESAIVSVSTQIQDGFRMSGEGRLFVSYDDGTEALIGKGKVSGFPVGLDGDELTVDFICRSENHDERVDNLYASVDAQIEPEVVSPGGKRRAEGFIPFFVYTDPVSHAVSFADINGDPYRLHTLTGEGAPPGQSAVFSIAPTMKDDPIKSMIVESVANWQQVNAKVIDYGQAAVGVVRTATPEEYVASVDNVMLEGGGDYLFTGSDVKPRFNSSATVFVAARKAFVDSRTSVLHPILYESFLVSSFAAPDINVLTSLSQIRNERARVRLTMDHGQFGGREVREEYYLDEPEKRFKITAPYPVKGKGFSRVDLYPDSIHYNATGSSWGGRSVFFPRSLMMRAYTMIVDASYCVVLRISTTADEALKMRVGDRLRVSDTRLPGGYAEGRVSLVSVVIDDNATGEIEVECSTCTSLSTTGIPDTASLSVSSGADIPSTEQMNHLNDGNPFFFLEAGVEHTEGRYDPYDDPDIPSQLPIIEQINVSNGSGIPPILNPGITPIPEMYDVRGRIRDFLPPTIISVKLRDVGEVPNMPEHVIEMTPVEVRVKNGVKDG